MGREPSRKLFNVPTDPGTTSHMSKNDLDSLTKNSDKEIACAKSLGRENWCACYSNLAPYEMLEDRDFIMMRIGLAKYSANPPLGQEVVPNGVAESLSRSFGNGKKFCEHILTAKNTGHRHKLSEKDKMTAFPNHTFTL